MKRRMLSILLALSMVLTMLPTALAAKTDYADTDGHWAEKSIERWSVYGIVEGNNNLFDPNGDLSRAQLAAIIARLLNLPMAGSAGFGDTIGHWAEDVINRCAAAGIMLGDGVNARPDDPISREETMVMLGRALGIKPVENADLSGYGDSSTVADWAEGYVAAMTEAGIVNGIDGNLAPTDEINRASTMTILDRAITTYANEPGQTVEATGEGIVLVAAEDVTVTGEAESIVVAQGAAGGTTNLDNATVGTVTVQAENSSVVVGENTTVTTVEVTEQAAGAAVEVTEDAVVETVTTAAPESTVTVSGTVTTVTTTETAESAAVEVTKDAVVETVTTAAPESTITVSGTVTTVNTTETATGTTVEAEKGAEIENVDTKAEDTVITGGGTVSNVIISGDNTTVDTEGTKVETSEGTTGTVAGDKELEGGENTTIPTTPSTPSVSEHEHSYTPDVTAPTCTEQGYTTYTCRCGDSYKDDEVAALGHTEVVDAAVAPTCTETGLTEGKHCSVCETVLVAQTEVPAKGHEDENPKDYVCDVCRADLCTENDHTLETIPAVDATCTATGLTEGKKCSKCGEILVEQEIVEKLPHTEETIPAKAATCTETGLTAGKKCSVCQTILTVQENIAKYAHQAGVQCPHCKVTEANSFDTLKAAIEIGGNIKLTANVELAETAIVAAGKTVVLDLNGKTIDAGWADESAGKHIYAITNNGTLTITGNGTINARGNFNYGTLTLESGTINGIDTNGGYAVKNDAGATFTMKGGSINVWEDTPSDSATSGNYDATALYNQGTAYINGGNITSTANFTYAISNAGTLTITDGTIKGRGGVSVNNGSLVTIKGGKIQNDIENNATGHAVYVEGGKVVIEAGEFTATNDKNDGNSVVYVAAGAEAEITGGTFITNEYTKAPYGPTGNTITITGGTYNKNPSAYVAPGYEVKESSGTYTVEPFKLDSKEELLAALAKGGTVTLGGDITYQGSQCIYGSADAVMTGGELNGNNKTFAVTRPAEPNNENKYDYTALSVNGGTIKDLTINDGFRAIFLENMTANVTLDNLTLGGEGVCYCINTGTNANKTYTLTVTNSRINGWTSFNEIASASFTNCNFGQGGYYTDESGRLLKPYVNTTVKNCSFVNGFYLDLSSLTENHKVTLESCNVGDVALTAEKCTASKNWQDYSGTLTFFVELPSWANSLEDCVTFSSL